MGLRSARRKRANSGQMRAAADPIPGSAIGLRLIKAEGFDKAVPLPSGLRVARTKIAQPRTKLRSQEKARPTWPGF